MVSECTQLYNSRDVATGFFESISGSMRRRYAPDHIADIVGHQQRTRSIHRHADRPAARFALLVQEPAHDVLGQTRGAKLGMPGAA